MLSSLVMMSGQHGTSGGRQGWIDRYGRASCLLRRGGLEHKEAILASPNRIVGQLGQIISCLDTFFLMALNIVIKMPLRQIYAVQVILSDYCVISAVLVVVYDVFEA